MTKTVTEAVTDGDPLHRVGLAKKHLGIAVASRVQQHRRAGAPPPAAVRSTPIIACKNGLSFIVARDLMRQKHGKERWTPAVELSARGRHPPTGRPSVDRRRFVTRPRVTNCLFRNSGNETIACRDPRAVLCVIATTVGPLAKTPMRTVASSPHMFLKLVALVG